MALRARLPLEGCVLHSANLEVSDYSEDERTVTTCIRDATVISSLTTSSTVEAPMHKVILDIDVPVKLVPSSTRGHFHLYIDKEVPHEAYFNLVRAFVDAGIVEPGYLGASERRGYTSARLPWIKKNINK